MPTSSKLKKRGFVMTGGGAKGLYEAGVIHAFHISGMEFDVITGSSIGAMNSIFFAEYLFHKRQLPAEVRQDPARAVEALDERVKAYHHAWLQMPDKRVIDDSETGPIGLLKNDLQSLNVDLPLLVRLGWWWTDPDRNALPPPQVWPSLARIGATVVGHMGGPGELMRILKNHRSDLLPRLARTYLKRFRLDRSLIPADQDHKLKDIFTQPVSPLRLEHLTGEVSAPDSPGQERYILVDPRRTLCEYDQQGITVRLTRANYRTGRLELSTYVPLEGFVRFMEKQAWRLQAYGPDKIPLGSFRLLVPGNPVAINAALCSGRFPGVFAPFPISDIYSKSDPENEILYHLLSSWLSDPPVSEAMQRAYQSYQPADGSHWENIFTSWRDSATMRDYFPRSGDVYVDGGAIDNTPSNSAVDFVKEWVEKQGLSKRDVELELYVIFLEAEPKADRVLVDDPALFQVVTRTLDIQGAAKKSADANTVQTINTFGQRGESLAQALQVLLKSLEEILPTLPPDQQEQLQQRVYNQARELALRGFLGDGPEGIIDRLDQWATQLATQGLPLEVEAVKIYPEEMPLSTLQFTERLGYHKENAIRMLTMGCYNTLWTLRRRLEGQPPGSLDEQDRQALGLVQKWMGIPTWPETFSEQEALRQGWHCQRTACVYHAQHCPHGAMIRS
jgi:hypothetical protein